MVGAGFPEETVEDKPFVHYIKRQCFVLYQKVRGRNRNLLNETQIFPLVPDSILPSLINLISLGKHSTDIFPTMQSPAVSSCRWSGQYPRGALGSLQGNSRDLLSIENAPLLEDLPLNLAELIRA